MVMSHELVTKYGIDSKNDIIITGSLIALRCVSTASWANESISSSYSKTASIVENIAYGSTLLLMGG